MGRTGGVVTLAFHRGVDALELPLCELEGRLDPKRFPSNSTNALARRPTINAQLTTPDSATDPFEIERHDE